MAGIQRLETNFSTISTTRITGAELSPSVPAKLARSQNLQISVSPNVANIKAQPEIQFSSVLLQYAKTWTQADSKTKELLGTVPQNIRPLLDAQMTLSRLDLQTQLLTKVADAVGNTVRRTQQMAGG